MRGVLSAPIAGLALRERPVHTHQVAELEEPGPAAHVARELELRIARAPGRVDDPLVQRDPAFGIVRAEADEGRIVERLREAGRIAQLARRLQRLVQEDLCARAIDVAELGRQARQQPRAQDGLRLEAAPQRFLERVHDFAIPGPGGIGPIREAERSPRDEILAFRGFCELDCASVERTRLLESDGPRPRCRESEMKLRAQCGRGRADELLHLERALVPARRAVVVVKPRGVQACPARQLRGALGIEERCRLAGVVGAFGDAVVRARARVLERSGDPRMQRAPSVPAGCQFGQEGVANQRVREAEPMSAVLDEEARSLRLAHAAHQIDVAVERLRQHDARTLEPDRRGGARAWRA